MRITPRFVMQTLLGIALLVLPLQLFAARRERVVEAWRPVNYNVALTLDDRLTQIAKARTEITIEVLRVGLALIDLDFGEMPIDGVWIDGKVAQFDRAPGTLNVHLQNPAAKGQRFVVVVEYHGKPKDGLILTNDKDGKPSATGDNWPDRVHHWIPCLDHPSAKATVTFTVTAPQRDLVVANGKLEPAKGAGPTNGTGNRTWTYVEGVPIPAYCMVIAVGEYAKSGPATAAITPLDYYIPQSDARRAVLGFAAAAPSLKFFSESIAPYPYEKLALIVGATRFGGMENSSAIVFAENLLSPRSGPPRLSRAFKIDQGLEEVVAHEIAHQWFGDSVTESTWADLWLSEGFATYFAGLVIEKYDGADAFRAYMERAANTYFQYEKQKRTPIHDTETEKLFDLLNANNYQKGAWVLHMLRSQLGDDAFFRGLKAYYNAHKDSTANTEDLRDGLEKASGRNLKEFFDRWVYGSGHPQYEWGANYATRANGEVVLMIDVRQTQPGEAFMDPLTIEVTSGDVKQRRTVLPVGKRTGIVFSLAAPPIDVKIDPDGTLLKEVVSPTH